MAPLSTMRHRDPPSASGVSSEELMVPLTTFTTNNEDKGDDHDLGYEDLGLNGSAPNHDIEAQDYDDDDYDEDLPLWKRIPPCLAVAMGLFSVSVLTCVITVYQYKALNHSGWYAFGFASATAGIIGLSAFVIGTTFWYTQQDLERSLEQQERMHALLSSVYPEHVLERLLEEDDDVDEENQRGAEEECTPTQLEEEESPQWLRKLKRRPSAANLLMALQSQQVQPKRKSLQGLSSSPFKSDERVPRSRRIAADRSPKSSLALQSTHHADTPHHDDHHNCKKSVTDLYPNTTVFYSQIVGFTAWSSQRAPSQVFELLETIFCQFDALATRGNIFKVESIADSYIAVTGLPEADPDHAVRMAQFASDCLTSFLDTTERLERSLGPDTGELQLRTGLHSGPVTAGVLKGERSRFQLFGNTVNYAVIVKKQGQGNHIHLSRETAELLQEAGKAHWVVPREKSVAGNTFWLDAAKGKNRRASCSHLAILPPPSPTFTSDSSDDGNYSLESDDSDSDDTSSVLSAGTGLSNTSGGSNQSPGARKKAWTMQDIVTAKEQRLIEWTVDQLALMLKKIVARRQATARYEERQGLEPEDVVDSATPPILHYTPTSGMVLDEVQEMIVIPRYKDALLREDALQDASTVELGDRVVEELTNFVSTVTTFYYDPSRNPFHNFMHASHVLMSVVKMMQRIVSPSQAALEKTKVEQGDEKVENRRKSMSRTLSMEELHDHTYGITTDPLTQFAVVFAALIHDIDHPGVPNATLVEEQTRLARVYKNRSISEQNSLDMAWDLLMDPSYQHLVRTICSSQAELKRFRQLLVQTVMATDIADVDLRAARNERWDIAFAKKTPQKKEDESMTALSSGKEVDSDNHRNRKATIVLEHLMQASDIAHTMQHWEVFKKWNEKLFREMYLAYLHGRSEKDPGDFWYKGEIGFFKFYIIPLAKKLSDCGVFGVSSDEYLNYAQHNLQIWESKGEEVVAEFIEGVRRDYGTKEDRREDDAP